MQEAPAKDTRKEAEKTKYPMQTSANDTESYTGGNTTESVEEAAENSGDKNQEETDIGDEMVNEDELETVQNAIDIGTGAPIEFVDMAGLNFGERNKMRKGRDGGEGNYLCSRSEDSL